MAESEISPWRSEEHLTTPEEVAAYLEAAFADGDPELIGYALGVVARSRGMTVIAERAGLDQQNLPTTLSPEGHPDFATVLKVVRALGLKLTLAAE